MQAINIRMKCYKENGKQRFSILDFSKNKEIKFPDDYTYEQAESFFKSYCDEQQQKAMKKTSKKFGVLGGKMYDGHFWVERDGKIIDPVLRTHKHIGDNLIRYHKEAPLTVQPLIIETMYRTMEEKQGFKRDSEEWANFLLFHRNMIGACFHNALREIMMNGGTLKCGSVGYYFKNGNTKKGFECPANSVWWEYGCGNYSKFVDFFKTQEENDIDTYWTIEDERDESKY